MTSTDNSPRFDGLTPVDKLMGHWPDTIRVFLDFHMACIGCPVGRIHTLADACTEYGIVLASFIAALEHEVGGAELVRQSPFPGFREK
jgi:hybrid cluster-associated redox disulfide protein